MAQTPEEARQLLTEAGIDWKTGQPLSAAPAASPHAAPAPSVSPSSGLGDITPAQARQQLMDAGIDPGTGASSIVRSTPVTDQELAWQQWQEQFPGVQDTDDRIFYDLLPTLGGTSASILFESAANQATQALPPHISKWVATPLRIASAITGAWVGGRAGKDADISIRMMRGEQFTDEEIEELKQKAGKREAKGEAWGQGIGGVGGKILTKAFAKSSSTAIPDTVRLSEKIADAGTRVADGIGTKEGVELARKGKANLSGAQLTQNRFIDFLESLSEKAMLDWGGLWRKKEVVQPAAHEQMKREFIGRLWDRAGDKMSANELANTTKAVLRGQKNLFQRQIAQELVEDTGRPIMEAVEHGVNASDTIVATRKALEKQGSDLYKSVFTDPRIAQAPVGMGGVRALGKKAAKKGEAGAGMGGSAALERTGKALADVKPFRTLEEADILRSSILEEMRGLIDEASASGAKAPRRVADLQKMADSIDNAMQNTLNKIDPQLAENINEARAIWREKSELFGSSQANTIARLAKNNPNQMLSWVFAPGSTDRVQTARQILGDDVFKEMRRTWLADTLETAFTKKNTGEYLEQVFKKHGMNNLTAIMDDVEDAKALVASADSFKGIGKEWIEGEVADRVLRNAERYPGKLAKNIFQPKNTQEVLLFKNKMPPRTFNGLVAAWGEEAVRKGDLTTTLTNMGDETLEAMFGKAGMQDIKDIGALETLIKQRTESGSWAMLPSMIHAATVMQMIRGVTPETLGVLGGDLGVSGLIGKILGNPKAAKLLAEGLQDPAKVDFFARKAAAEVFKSIAQEERRKAIAAPIKGVSNKTNEMIRTVRKKAFGP